MNETIGEVWPALLAGLAALAVSFLVLGSKQDGIVARRTVMLVRSAGFATPRDVLLAEPFFERALGPVLDGLANVAMRLAPRRSRREFESRLAAAGCARSGTRRLLLAFQVLCWTAGAVLGGILAPQRLADGILAGFAIASLGVFAPRLYLVRKARLRREQITRELPDALDLLTASVEAGLGFDSAIMRLSAPKQGRHSPLREEFSRYLSEIHLGQPRPEALRALADRTRVTDLQTVVAALIQSDQLGVGVATVLRAQSQHVRTRRRQRAQTEALQAPVKLLFPLVFFIFPAMFVVTLGPAVLRVIDTFTKVHHP